MMKFEVMVGDSRKLLKRLKKDSVHCCVTSPPYFGHRDYKNKKQIGREKTPEEYIEHLVAVFREVHRVLRPDGTLWVNIGDSYASGWSCSRRNVVGNGTTNEGRSGRLNRLTGDLKDKDLIGIPWMLAFALRADGWYLRAENL